MSTAINPIAAPPLWQTDPTRVKRLAVIKGAGYAIMAQTAAGRATLADDDLIGSEDTLADLVQILLNDKCASIWIMPPHLLDWAAQVRQLLADPPAELKVHPLSDSDGALVGAVVQRARGGAPVPIHLLDTDAWGVAGTLARTTAEDFGAGLFLAAYLLGMQLRFSPSYTGLQMLRQEIAHKHYEVPPISEECYDFTLRNRPTYIQWARQELPDNERVVVRKYDRNSSFVASAGVVPVGEPTRTFHFLPGVPGVYRIWFRAPASWPVDLPGPFHVGEGAGSYPLEAFSITAWEPQIRLALASGWDIFIYEGYAWPEKHQRHDLFRAWRERLWLARLSAKTSDTPATRIAGTIIKKVGVAAIGRLKQPRGHAIMDIDEARAEGLRILHRDTDEQGEWTGLAEVIADLGKTDLLRPDWWGTIIAGANERLFAALYAHRHNYPILGYVDAVYCLVPWLETELEPQRLGKWKLEREMTLGRYEVLKLNGLSAQAMVKQLAAFYRAQSRHNGEHANGEPEAWPEAEWPEPEG